MTEKGMTAEQIAKRVRIIRSIYLVLACLALVSLLFDLQQPSSSRGKEQVGTELVFALVFATAFRGLRKKRSWAVPLLAITSISVLMQMFFMIFKPVWTVPQFVDKLILYACIYFFWYQAFFFSKYEVKKYFGAKGTVLF